MKNIQKVSDYLAKSGTFFLSTVDGNKPKCRPFSFHMLEDDKLYFGVGTFKNVYKQIVANLNIEICAINGNEFLRYYGTADFVSDEALIKKALDLMPDVKKIYEENGFNMALFCLNDATADFYAMMGIKESIQF